MKHVLGNPLWCRSSRFSPPPLVAIHGQLSGGDDGGNSRRGGGVRGGPPSIDAPVTVGLTDGGGEGLGVHYGFRASC